jgi:RHS repeat-associated protein
MTLDTHRNTPSLEVNDSRGLSICQVEYVRNADTSLEPLITRLSYDVAGRLVSLRDPRLVDAPKPNLTHVYGLSSRSLMVDRVDAGRRINLPGVAGEVVQHWDERGNRWRNTYDEKLRLLTVAENNQPEVEALTYWRGDADQGNNRCGQLHKKVDPSSTVEFKSFSLHGLPFEETRTLLRANVYTTKWTYGADGKPLSQTDAGGHQQHSRYDISGQLKQVTLQIDADSPVLPILEDAQYNADGQPIKQLTGNKVVRTWKYDLADGRLTNMMAGVAGQPELQNLEYFYDPVGNVVRIDNHAFKPVFFKNQLIDGSREFTYSSLYQLLTATGHDATPTIDIPGLPLPSDPGDHLNYKQCFEYDKGNNLIKLTHSRAVGGYTRHMYIDQSSNRGVLWTPGDPPPVFESLFDRHGNLQQLQPGQPVTWNSRNEPSSITLIERDTGLNDEETYRYSDGSRLYKRHETHTSLTTHFHEVHYLNGLEIRTRETGEVLHVINLPAILGNVRCLHWVSQKPEGIDNNQVRYILDDNLKSSLTELDQDARIISREEYYAFGGTALLTKGTAPGIGYKTIRYSGKEMDVSGLYSYGRRYYAPWLRRWISPDPAGEVGGLNLYAMVGNNPISFIDILGLGKPGDIIRNTSQSMVTSNTSNPFIAPAKTPKNIAKQLEAEHKAKHPYYDFTQTKKNKLVVHAGGYIPHQDTEQTVLIQGHHNAPITLKAVPGLSVYRESGNSITEPRIYRIDDLGKVKEHLTEKYEALYADNTSTIQVFKGSSTTPINLQDVRREGTSQQLLPETWSAVQDHIKSNNYLIPEPDGLPGAHGEVGVLNTASMMSTGSEPNIVQIWTDKIQTVPAAVAFPTCTNCTGIMISAQGGKMKPDVQTGNLEEKLENFRRNLYFG